jgi:hypothetical protein
LLLPSHRSWLGSRRSWAIVASAVLGATGCASELSLRAPTYHPQRARIVFMPAMVALYTLASEGQMATPGADGLPSLTPDAHLEFQEDRSKTVRQTVDAWLKNYVEEHDSRIGELDEVAKTHLPSNAFYNVMENLTNAIVIDWLDNTWSAPLSHWGREARFEGWESALEADYVVFVKFKGAYETRALQSANGLSMLVGGTRVIARRVATLAVVDLHSGRVVSVQGVKFNELTPGEIRADLAKLVQGLTGTGK